MNKSKTNYKKKKFVKKQKGLSRELSNNLDNLDTLDNLDKSETKSDSSSYTSKFFNKQASKPILSDEPEYTILDEFIKRNKQFIILVLGLPCSNKSEIAKELVVDLGLPILNINNYLIDGKFIDKEVDGVKFKLYEHPDNYNWKKLNEDVNKLKKRGVILYGNYLDIDKIDWKPDVTYFISMGYNICKKKLVEKKLLPYDENDPKIAIYFNKIFNPIYEEIKTKFKINRFFNLKEETTFLDVYNELFNGLIGMINSRLKNGSNPSHKKSHNK